MSTQILTNKIKLENDLKEHILIKDKIAQIYPKTVVHAVSIDYAPNEQTIIKHVMTSHGLAAAILHAYNNHQHLRLTPDDIWLTIAQGVSHHINFNAENFRSRFVDHEGKKEIGIFVGDILVDNNSHLEGDWPEVVNRLVVKTDEAVEKIDIKSLLECDFSTTTNNSLTASRIVLLDMVKAYFSYRGYFLCGIPKVTLDGTLEDWIKLQEKVIQLRQLDLDMDFWLDRLDPVVWKLVETYKGEIDEDFWARIVSLEYFGSGGDCKINGWMTAFFPYENNGKKLNNSIEPYDIPNGKVEVPFTTEPSKIGGPEFFLKFVAGFLGAQQKTIDDTNELVVSPIIGWFIIDDKSTKEKNSK